MRLRADLLLMLVFCCVSSRLTADLVPPPKWTTACAGITNATPEVCDGPNPSVAFSHPPVPSDLAVRFSADALGEALAGHTGLLSLSLDVTGDKRAVPSGYVPSAEASAFFADYFKITSTQGQLFPPLAGTKGFIKVTNGLTGGFLNTCVATVTFPSPQADCQFVDTFEQQLEIQSPDGKFAFDSTDSYDVFRGIVPPEPVLHTGITPYGTPELSAQNIFANSGQLFATCQGADCSRMPNSVGRVWVVPITFGDYYLASWELKIYGAVVGFDDCDPCTGTISALMDAPPHFEVLDANMRPLSNVTIQSALGVQLFRAHTSVRA